MKNLLISTDFSNTATHAARYGYNLAKQIKANVILCNAVIIPAEIPEATSMVWPVVEFNALMKESAEDLEALKTHLESKNGAEMPKPQIRCLNEEGMTTDVINEMVVNEKADMVIIGTHGHVGISQLMVGNHTRQIVDSTLKPLLLIPPGAPLEPINKIAFATDFEQPEKDIESIYNLVPFAELLNANILITHVCNDKKCRSDEFQKWLKQFLSALSNKADYPHIYYRIIKDFNIEDGLDWLCNNAHIDMLAMVHRRHNFFDKLLKGSHTQKMAGHIDIPLLVIPETQQKN